MSEEVNTQGQENPQGQTQDPVENLPSNQEVVKTPEEQLAAMTAERDQARKDHSELEKLMGRKAQEAGDEKKQQREAMEQTERQNTQQEYISSVVDDIVSNGMAIGEEVQTKLTELGISDTEVKLAAYEYKDKIDSVVQVFGDRATYDEAVKFGAEKGMSQAQLAAHGLKALYAEANVEQPQDSGQRVMGNSNPVPPQRGYGSMDEYSKDLRWAGRDPQKIKQVRDKVSQTRDGILG